MGTLIGVLALAAMAVIMEIIIGITAATLVITATLVEIMETPIGVMAVTLAVIISSMAEIPATLTLLMVTITTAEAAVPIKDQTTIIILNVTGIKAAGEGAVVSKDMGDRHRHRIC